MTTEPDRPRRGGSQRPARPARSTRAGGRPPGRGGAPGGPRRRASHSLQAVLDAAVGLLDEQGESALTFRALAGRLGGGVGSIYWYVASKDELLERAADHVLDQVLFETERFDTDDPIDDLRGAAMVLFGAVEHRPWLAAYFMRNTSTQPNSLRYYERVGQTVMRLGLPPRETFHAASAVVGYVMGIAADLGQQPTEEMLRGELHREDYLAEAADAWRALDPDDWPFLHAIADEFSTHDDTDQFRAGLDLLLDGLRRQAERHRAGG